MGTTQKLASDMSTFDLRPGHAAANDPDMRTPDFLEGVQVMELAVEVIIL